MANQQSAPPIIKDSTSSQLADPTSQPPMDLNYHMRQVQDQDSSTRRRLCCPWGLQPSFVPFHNLTQVRQLTVCLASAP